MLTDIKAILFKPKLTVTLLMLIASTVAAQPEYGTIKGSLSYPSDYLPPLKVCAEHIWKNSLYCITTNNNQTKYIIKVTPGSYYVFASTTDRLSTGLYSSAVPCGLKYECNNHSLMPVVVQSGQVAAGIDPGDWYP